MEIDQNLAALRTERTAHTAMPFPSLTPERYEQLRQAFIAACDLQPADQEIVLQELCLEARELREMVAELLANARVHHPATKRPHFCPRDGDFSTNGPTAGPDHKVGW